METKGSVIALRIFAILVAGILLVGRPVQAKEYYKYIDEQGAYHFVDDPEKVPPKYRNQLKRVESEVSRAEGGDQNILKRLWNLIQNFPDDSRRWLEKKPAEDTTAPMNDLRGVIWQTLKQTWLLYTLLGEVLALGLFLVALWFAQDFPTQSERRRLSLGLILAYAILLVSSLLFLVRPQLKNFFIQSDINAESVLTSGNLSESEQARITQYRQAAQTWAKRIP